MTFGVDEYEQAGDRNSISRPTSTDENGQNGHSQGIPLRPDSSPQGKSNKRVRRVGSEPGSKTTESVENSDNRPLQRTASLQTLWDTNKNCSSRKVTSVQTSRAPDDPLPLRNLGNTCYLNSMVQLLFVLNSFFGYLTEKFQQVQSRVSQESFKMTTAFLKLFAEYRRQKPLSLSPDEMNRPLNELKTCVGKRSPDFNSTMQQDTVEFLTLVLGTIDEEFEKIKDMPTRENPIKRFFEMEFDSHLKCLECGQYLALPKQKTHAMYLCIPKLSKDPTVTLQHIIGHFFKEEKIEHKCEVKGCRGREKTRSVLMSKLPRVLVLQLGRYSEDGTKRQETIHAPLQILMPTTESMTSVSFQLVGVVCHHGSTLYRGHYVSFVYQSENQTWYFCDDDSITKTALEHVQDKCKNSGYCFLYLTET